MNKKAGAAGEVRIIGGRWRRSKLPVPDLPGLRPTGDRLRETLFNWLGQELGGWKVLDAFAGSGALGLEAASRGAQVTLVEQDARALRSLREVVSRLDGAADCVRVQAGDAFGQIGPGWDLVLLDPPYAAGEVGRALAALVEARVLAPEAVVVVESGRRHPVPTVAGLARLDERRYGDSVITQLVAAPPDDGAGGAATAGEATDVAARGGTRSG